MTLAKAKARANKTFIAPASLTIVKIFLIVQATGVNVIKPFPSSLTEARYGIVLAHCTI